MSLLARSVLIAGLCSILFPVDGAFAQLRDRGPLSRFGARRDERLNRTAPPAPPRPAASPGAGSRNPAQQAPPNTLGPNAPGTPNPNGSAGSALDDPAVRSANYAGPLDAARSNVGAASATGSLAPPNRLPYAGPGVLIRLPAELAAEVNYLVDDTEHLVVHSGEDQHLRLKGTYEVRFSRGITEDGRNLGEARYTVTEGVYHFAATDKGWELYRDTDSVASVLRNRGSERSDRVVPPVTTPPAASNLPATASAAPTPKPPASASVPPTPRPSSSGGVPPTPKPPATASAPASTDATPTLDRLPPPPDSEETLPVPRSILERP